MKFKLRKFNNSIHLAFFIKVIILLLLDTLKVFHLKLS